MHVLVVEDEPKMASVLGQGLIEEGYHAVVAADGYEALALARSGQFDLIVLDVMLPGLDGFQIAHRLRSEKNLTPILMLTARDADEDIVRGLNFGADDYLTKPFSFNVFLARVRAVSRRGPIAEPVAYQIGDLSLNTATREVKRSGRAIRLTAREYSLLELLARRSPRILPRDEIFEAVWGFEVDISANNLEAYVHLLRSKLEEGNEPKLLHTIRGVGYCLRAGEDL
jgi:two-component system copper resistance phosphate regulon response regulator CusR